MDELIPRAKPEVMFLNGRELCKIFRLESVAGDRGIFDETQHSMARVRATPTLRAIPLFTFKAALAAEATFHRALTLEAIYERNVLRR